MTRSIFGWDLPPGVTQKMIDEQVSDEGCGVCFKHVEECICPSCLVCEQYGEPSCYSDHGMSYTYDQLISRAEKDVSDAQDALNGAEMYLDQLKAHKPMEERDER